MVSLEGKGGGKERRWAGVGGVVGWEERGRGGAEEDGEAGR